MNYKTNKCISFIAILAVSLCLSNNIFAQFPSWGAISSGTNGVVNSIIEYNGKLIAAGSFTTPAHNIARYNGYKWDSLGSGLNDTVFALTIYNNKLIAVGAFDTAGGVVCHKIAQWNDSTWAPVGTGADSTIYTVDTSGVFLIIGGKFLHAGGISANRLAVWQGLVWTALGQGVNGNVYDVMPYRGGLIIGGAFTMAGSDTAKKIARYDSAGVFHAMGPGIDSGDVYCLSDFLGLVYAGGSFITIGGDTAKHIATWNDTAWAPVGTGINGTVKTMDQIQLGLMVIGGSFTNVNGTSANNIVAYGGSLSFAPYGGGLSGGTPVVNKVLMWRGVTIGAGLFTSVNRNIARWGLLPFAPELISPDDGAQGLSVTPDFLWSGGQWMYSFTNQVARDANFLNITFADSGLFVTADTIPSATPLLNLTTYFWHVRAVNGLGNGPWSLIRFFSTGFLGVVNNNEIPLRFNLYQNFPNPFNPVTKIKFDLPRIRGDNDLKLVVYNITGQKVAELLNTKYAAGKWELNFDATNLASGIYFCKIEAGPYVKTNKMILLK